MQVTASAAPNVVTQHFSTLWAEADSQSATRAQEAIEATAADFGVTASNITFGPAILESLPPQGDVSGDLTGPRGAVEAAAKAIDELRLGF